MLTEPRRPILTMSPSRCDRGRLADQAQVGDLAALADQLDQRAGAVDRLAFLVAGDDEADRAGLGRDVAPPPRPSPRSSPSCRPRRARRAAAAPLGRERRRCSSPRPAGPRRGARRRRSAGCPAGPRRIARQFSTVPAGDEAVHLEPERREHRLERVEHRPARGRHAVAGDQPLRRGSTTSLEFPIASGVDEAPTAVQPEDRAMPKIDLDAIPQTNRTGYPPPVRRSRRGPLVPPPRARRGADRDGREPRRAQARRVVVAAPLARARRTSCW